MKIVISLGGSVISPQLPDNINEIAELIKKASADYDIYTVVGGGKTARQYIQSARTFCNDERYLDKIGIAATRLNALLLNAFFNQEIPATIDKAVSLKPPVIMGGTHPGHSTDAVAAMLAEKLGSAVLIIATDVDGVYDKDPKKHKNVKKFKEIHIRDLLRKTGDIWSAAGTNTVIDGIACKIIEKAHILTYVVNGKKIKYLENAIYGKEFNGTVVKTQ